MSGEGQSHWELFKPPQGLGLGARWRDPQPLPEHQAPPQEAKAQGRTYQNPKGHDLEQALQGEERGEDDVEHPQGVLVGHRGAIELGEGGDVSAAWPSSSWSDLGLSRPAPGKGQTPCPGPHHPGVF